MTLDYDECGNNYFMIDIFLTSIGMVHNKIQLILKKTQPS